jgi:hypothetical protein
VSSNVVEYLVLSGEKGKQVWVQNWDREFLFCFEYCIKNCMNAIKMQVLIFIFNAVAFHGTLLFYLFEQILAN